MLFQQERIRLSAILSLFALSIIFLGSSLSETTAAGRIVAVGDIHGDFDSLVAILQETGIINEDRGWIGGKTTLVQTGDFLDRGTKIRQVMDLLMELEQQAKRQGGQVFVLLGNHEMMNLMGDVRDVSSQALLAFADDESQKRRTEAYQTYLDFLARNPNGSPVSSDSEEEWMKRHPPGFLEYQMALEPNGRYGRWLRRLPAIVQVGDTMFVHGGIHPQLSSLNVAGINKRIRSEIQEFDGYKRQMIKSKKVLSFSSLEQLVAAAKRELARLTEDGAKAGRQKVRRLESFLTFGSWLSVHPDGPLWFRGFAQWSEQDDAAHLSNLLETYHVRHFVVGHTTQLPGRIQVRFGGRVFLIDTGMLDRFYPGGQASALEIEEGEFEAVYRGHREILLVKDGIELSRTKSD